MRLVRVNPADIQPYVEPTMPAAQQPSTSYVPYGRNVASGMTFGLAPYISAAEDQFENGQGYLRNLAQEKNQYNQAALNNPKSALASNILGGTALTAGFGIPAALENAPLMGVGAKTLADYYRAQPMATAAAKGAMMGAGYGAASGAINSPTLASVPANMGIGAAYGGALGGGLSGVIQGAQTYVPKAVNYVRGMSPSIPNIPNLFTKYVGANPEKVLNNSSADAQQIYKNIMVQKYGNLNKVIAAGKVDPAPINDEIAQHINNLPYTPPAGEDSNYTGPITVTGSGPNGMATEADIQRAILERNMKLNGQLYPTASFTPTNLKGIVGNGALGLGAFAGHAVGPVQAAAGSIAGHLIGKGVGNAVDNAITSRAAANAAADNMQAAIAASHIQSSNIGDSALDGYKAYNPTVTGNSYNAPIQPASEVPDQATSRPPFQFGFLPSGDGGPTPLSMQRGSTGIPPEEPVYPSSVQSRSPAEIRAAMAARDQAAFDAEQASRPQVPQAQAPAQAQSPIAQGQAIPTQYLGASNGNGGKYGLDDMISALQQGHSPAEIDAWFSNTPPNSSVDIPPDSEPGRTPINGYQMPPDASYGSAPSYDQNGKYIMILRGQRGPVSPWDPSVQVQPVGNLPPQTSPYTLSQAGQPVPIGTRWQTQGQVGTAPLWIPGNNGMRLGLSADNGTALFDVPPSQPMAYPGSYMTGIDPRMTSMMLNPDGSPIVPTQLGSNTPYYPDYPTARPSYDPTADNFMYDYKQNIGSLPPVAGQVPPVAGPTPPSAGAGPADGSFFSNPDGSWSDLKGNLYDMSPSGQMIPRK